MRVRIPPDRPYSSMDRAPAYEAGSVAGSNPAGATCLLGYLNVLRTHSLSRELGTWGAHPAVNRTLRLWRFDSVLAHDPPRHCEGRVDLAQFAGAEAGLQSPSERVRLSPASLR